MFTSFGFFGVKTEYSVNTVSKGVVYVSSGQGSLGVLMFEASSGGYIGVSLLHTSYTDLAASPTRLYAISNSSIDVYSVLTPKKPKLVNIILYDKPQGAALNITTNSDGHLLVTSPSLQSPAVFNGDGYSTSVCCVRQQAKRRVTLPHAVYIEGRELSVTEPSRGQLACSLESQAAPIDAAVHPLGDIWVTLNDQQSGVVIY